MTVPECKRLLIGIADAYAQLALYAQLAEAENKMSRPRNP
jgi:hypothetical protein